MALADAPEVEESNYSGAIIGTSVAVLGAAAAIFAARRCKKDADHFERQWALRRIREKIKMAVKEPYKQVNRLVYKVSIEGK